MASCSRVNSLYTRAINIQRDQFRPETVTAYLPTSRALQTLKQIAAGFEHTESPRAWALIGPYGSGKSAFALYLAALSSGGGSDTFELAAPALQMLDARLLQRFKQQFNARGLLPVMINGTPEALEYRLQQALQQAAVFDSQLQADMAQQLAEQLTLSQLMAQLEALQQRWCEQQGEGVLLVIDELGKFLEYQAHHSGANGIHLLQLLAEATLTKPIYIVVMLHQAFEYYSHGMAKRQRDEWTKVQGRYESIAFIEPAEQVLQVVASAFSEPDSAVRGETERWVELLMAQQALPGHLSRGDALELFHRCQPLHPLTLLLLPLLCQKVAQNERTLFTYLGSREPAGLQQQLDSGQAGEWIKPWQLYDYFTLNQPGVRSDPLTRHRWLEIETALERFGHQPSLPRGRELIKTIGLLNLIQAQQGFKASQPLLKALFGKGFNKMLTALERQSVITYRRFNQEYRLWAGSDFNLQQALESELKQQGELSIAAVLNQELPLSPLVTRRLTIERGTLRYYLRQFIDSTTVTALQQPAEVPTLWYYLRRVNDEPPPTPKSRHDILVVCELAERLLEAAKERYALLQLPQRHAELSSDAVAQKEYQSWLQNSAMRLRQQLNELLQSTHNRKVQQWFYRGRAQLDITDRRQLQHYLSQWMAACYPQSPKIDNELINRDKLSTSANTGRKKLIKAMLEAADQPDLGIQKYPAEKSLYRSLLLESGLHQCLDGRYQFALPTKQDDKCGFLPVFAAIDAKLARNEGSGVELEALYTELKQPPFGIKEGVLPLIILLYLLINNRDVALYYEGRFSERLSLAQMEMLCRRPKFFALERFQLEGLRADLFNRYLDSVVGRVREDARLIDIVKPLVSFINGLPEYSRQTRSLSPQAEAVRDAFEQAQSPGKLLFEALPQACGFSSLNDRAVEEQFIERLIQALRELKGAYDLLLRRWQSHLLTLLLPEHEGPEPLPTVTLRQQLQQRYQGLERLTPDKQGLGAFIRRLTDRGHEDQKWLESIATLLGRAPPAKWNDARLLEAEVALKAVAEKLKNLHQLSLAIDENPQAEDEVVLLKWVDSRHGERSRVVTLTPSQQQALQQKQQQVEGVLADLDESSRLALMASLLQGVTGEG
ncbi:hypothetical protein D5085_04250 [Ectothiorhodospiraceae bacterium BW-2]|nr:hypothetical protein D5085_04250 [Ectothiorhodospiraceae bacterium BW-2]